MIKDNAKWDKMVESLLSGNTEEADKLFHEVVLETSRKLWEEQNESDSENTDGEESTELATTDDDSSNDGVGDQEERIVDLENEQKSIGDSVKDGLGDIKASIEELSSEVKSLCDNNSGDDNDSDEDEGDSDGEGDDDAGMDMNMDMDMNGGLSGGMSMDDNDARKKDMEESIQRFAERKMQERRETEVEGEIEWPYARKRVEVSEEDGYRKPSMRHRDREISESELRKQIRQEMAEDAKLKAAPKPSLGDKTDAKARRSPVTGMKGGMKMSNKEEKGRPAPKSGTFFGTPSNKLKPAPKPNLGDKSDAKARKSAVSSRSTTGGMKMSNTEEKGRPAPKVGNLRKSK